MAGIGATSPLARASAKDGCPCFADVLRSDPRGRARRNLDPGPIRDAAHLIAEAWQSCQAYSHVLPRWSSGPEPQRMLGRAARSLRRDDRDVLRRAAIGGEAAVDDQVAVRVRREEATVAIGGSLIASDGPGERAAVAP